MKRATRTAKSRPPQRSRSTTKRAAAKPVVTKTAAAKRAAAKTKRATPASTATQRAVAKKRTTTTSKTQSAARPGRRPASTALHPGARPASGDKTPPGEGIVDWPAFVARHGVVLASARGPVPSVAEAVAGEPIVGSWWAHPAGKAIFAALSEIDDDPGIRCFKLVDGKITFVHRRLWPALVRLATAGVIAPARAATIQQEHLPSGEHRNIVTPFPAWVPDDVTAAAADLTLDAARDALGPWS